MLEFCSGGALDDLILGKLSFTYIGDSNENVMIFTKMSKLIPENI